MRLFPLLMLIMDKIIIKDLHLYAYHGVNAEEKKNGQNFYLDISVFADVSAACRSDCVEDTVSYAKIVKKITPVFCEQSFDLLEAAAQAVADCIFDNFSKVAACEILIKKPEAPVKAEFGWMGVEIRRERSE